MAYKFVEGAAYAAIPALEGAKRHMVVCTGRKGGRITFAWVNNVSVESVEACAGREIVRSTRPDGVYVVSAAAPVDIEAAAPVLELLREREAV